MRILLQPASGKDAKAHYADTIESSVPLTHIKDFVSEAEFDYLSELDVDDIQVWGMTPLNVHPRREWNDVERDDWVLFYADKKFIYVAEVYSKIHNSELATDLWGHDDKGRTWEYIYFMKGGKQIEVSYNPTILVKPDGTPYKPNHVVQRAVLLNELNSQAMMGYIEDSEGEIIDEDRARPSPSQETEIRRRVRGVRTPAEAEAEINSLSEEVANKPVKERIRRAKSLVRNPKMSRLVKEKVRYKCEICGVKPFKQKSGLPYAEAHHLEELSTSRIDNPKNMICVCPTCHRVIHYGSEESLTNRKELTN